MADSFDIVIIGGGPGGYVAAIRAAQLGMKTALVERDALGGICLNWGCIPTKALLRTSELYADLHRLELFGLGAGTPGFDITKVVKRSRDVAKQLSNGVTFLMRKNKIQVFDGSGRLSGPGKVSVTKEGAPVAELTSPHIILATGTRARGLPGLEPDGQLIWTYREAMVPPVMPKSLLVIGSGAIGIEFASFYRAMGAQVTVVEILPQILPVEDEAISAFARKQFEKQGMVIHTGAKVASLVKGADSVTANLELGDGSKQSITVDRVISAVGVQGNVEDIGLEATKVQVDRSYIKTNEWLETGEPGVYAIGDVAGPPCLAHKAMHEGVICVERIAGLETVRPLNRRRIPGCTYSHPQIASVGLTEKAAREAGYEIKVGSFPFIGNGKAIALGDPEGVAKTIFDAATGELLGAHLAGAEVTELIQGYVIAMTLETTEEMLMETIFPHPTISEAMHESVLAAYGRALHV
jgi:dihydrolipoamide dehydrogenase